MKLIAKNRIQGVKVLKGKGKGTKTAFAKDVFETSDQEGQRLVGLGAAEEYKVSDPLADEGEGGEEAKGTSEQKQPAKKTTAKKPTAKKPETGKAEDGSDTASDEDLGLS